MAATLLGCGDFFGGAGARRTPHPGAAISIAWIASIVGTVVAGLYVLVFPPEAFGFEDLRWAAGAALIGSLARPLLYLGMERGPMAVFAPVLGVVSLLVPATIGPLVGDRLSGVELAGVLLAIPAVVLIVAQGELPSWRTLRSTPALRLGALTGALLGAGALMLGQVDPSAEAMPALVIQVGSVLFIPAVARLTYGMPHSVPELRWFGILVGLVDIGAIIASVIAFQRGDVAVVAAIMAFAPAVTIALAWQVYDDRVRGWQWVGAAGAVICVVLFAIGA